MQITANNYFQRFAVDPQSSLLTKSDKNLALALDILSLALIPLGVLIYRSIRASVNPEWEISQKIKHVLLKPDGPLVPKKSVQIPHNKTDDTKFNAIKRAMQQRGIPLHPCPKEPETTYPLKEESKEGWLKGIYDNLKNLKGHKLPITQTEEEDLQILKKVTDNIQHITYSDLDKALSECVAKLNDALKTTGKNKYSVGFACGKSQQWMASLALKYLQFLPQSWFSLSLAQGTIGLQNVVPTAACMVDTVNEDTLVLFDDCSYSGTQLEGILYDQLDSKAKTKKTLYIVIPFLSSEAEKIIQKAQTSCKNLDIKLITSTTKIKLVKELFTEEKEKKLVELAVTQELFQTASHHSLCYTDWRLPDGTSFPDPLRFGYYMVQDKDQPDIWRPKNLFKEQQKIKRPYQLKPMD